MNLTSRRLFIFLAVFIFLSAGAYLIIRLAQGYRPDIPTRSLLPTGILVATSVPDGAQLFLDNKLKSATNTTLNLSPDEYEVEIKKDGYFPWKKRLVIKKELVTKAEAYLFSTFPDLKTLTFTGADKPILSPDGLKVVYAVATASASKQGLWVLDLADRPLGLPRDPRQIVVSSPGGGGRDFSQAEYEWAPDSKQILVSLKNENFLLEADRLNPATNLIDITPTVSLLKERWQRDIEIRQQAQLSKLPPKLLEALSEKVKDIQFSPDENKIFYTATASASIPEKILPPLPAASTQTQERNLKAGKSYAYDLEEDRNFPISVPAKASTSWFSTSKHIFIVQNDKISIVEADNTNWIDVYTGPFENSFAFPFPAGNRILILTSIGRDTPPNLYAISLH